MYLPQHSVIASMTFLCHYTDFCRGIIGASPCMLLVFSWQQFKRFIDRNSIFLVGVATGEISHRIIMCTQWISRTCGNQDNGHHVTTVGECRILRWRKGAEPSAEQPGGSPTSTPSRQNRRCFSFPMWDSLQGKQEQGDFSPPLFFLGLHWPSVLIAMVLSCCDAVLRVCAESSNNRILQLN